MVFLSLLDDRSKPKGSRDPLGFELVWTHFGRKVVGNLTTITSSLENFSVALLGFHWANELAVNVSAEDRQKVVRNYFLCYEQVAAYLRYYGKSTSIMGVNRVSQRLRDDIDELPIGIEPEKQILSDQASYGLWGLYSSAMRDTGLISGAERSLTKAGIVIAQALEDKLDKSSLLNLFTGKKISKKTLRDHAEMFMAALKDEHITWILLESLLKGLGNNKLQVELWEKTLLFIKDKLIPDDKNEFIELLVEHGISRSLKKELREIQEIERVLVALNNVFHYCRSQNGVDLVTVIHNLEKQDYNYSYLPENLSDSEFPHKDVINKALMALKAKRYSAVIVCVLELNKMVMKQRNGAPWVDLQPGKKLSVVMKNETAQLLSAEQLQTRWDYDYFLGAFLHMARNYQNSQAVEGNKNG